MSIVFHDIPEFDGIYSINLEGVVRSEDRWVKANNGGEMLIEGRTFEGWVDAYGYRIVKLSKDGISRSYKIHRLLATVFIPNPKNYRCVRHLNDIKSDNRIENLAWGTHGDNVNDAIRNGVFTSIERSGSENFMYGKKGILSPSYGAKRPGRLGPTAPRSRPIIDLKTGVFYDSVRDAAKYMTRFSIFQLYRMLRGEQENKTWLTFA